MNDYLVLSEFLCADRKPSTQLKPPRNVKLGGCTASEAFYLADGMGPERRALISSTLGNCAVVWSILLYAQHKYWLELFIGFLYRQFATSRSLDDARAAFQTVH